MAGHAAIVLDDKLNIWQLSDAVEKLSGWQQKELMGTPAEEIIYTASLDSDDERMASLEEAIANNRVSSGRAAIMTKTNALLPVFATILPLKKEDELIAVAIVLVDMRAQEELDKITADFIKGRTEKIHSLDTIEGFVELHSEELRELYEKQRIRALELEKALKELEKRKQVQEKLVQKILSAQEDERKRVSHDIHDDLLQPIITAQYQLQLIREMTGDTGIITKVDRLMNTLDAAVNATRHLLSDLRPVLLDEVGLKPTIERMVQNFGSESQINTTAEIGDLPELSPTLEMVAFRIIQEALINIKKHARANEVKVGLKVTDSNLIISIKDNGQGFDVEQVLVRGALSKNIGLESMRERAQMSGGVLHVKSEPGKGTEIVARLPV